MSKYDEIRSNGATVTGHYPALAAAFGHLIEDQDRHFALVQSLGASEPGRTTPLFPVDIVLLSVLNRSLDLVAGFTWAYDRWNLSTAAPVVRMQVDNVLRLALLAKAPPGLVTDVLLSGKQLNKEWDPLATQGKKVKLTDQRLRDHARDRFAWLDLVYEKSSGWVHFSSVHIGVTMQVTDKGEIFMRFPSDINLYPFDFLEQVLWAMHEATAGVLEIVEEFANGKAQAARGWEDEL